VDWVGSNSGACERERCAALLETEDLLAQVWDERADPLTNAVFVTLSRLRRKLGKPQVIETRPGVGYRITQPADKPTT
jgi:DNA-binding response OmpR family regulator